MGDWGADENMDQIDIKALTPFTFREFNDLYERLRPVLDEKTKSGRGRPPIHLVKKRPPPLPDIFEARGDCRVPENNDRSESNGD